MEFESEKVWYHYFENIKKLLLWGKNVIRLESDKGG